MTSETQDEHMYSEHPPVDEPTKDVAEAELQPAEPAPNPPARPADVPEKFWDAARGEIRIETLLQSYRELERKLGRSVPIPEGPEDHGALERLLTTLGRPERPEDYEIEPPHPLLAPDESLKQALHEAGMSQQQAQKVFELAADRLLPILSEANDELESARAVDRLEQHFGGAAAWRETSRQLKRWAEHVLTPETYETLAASYDGILALHEMMRKDEPRIQGSSGGNRIGLEEESLKEMVRDPRYWRDRDPQFIARVTDGYKRLFGT